MPFFDRENREEIDINNCCAASCYRFWRTCTSEMNLAHDWRDYFGQDMFNMPLFVFIDAIYYRTAKPFYFKCHLKSSIHLAKLPNSLFKSPRQIGACIHTHNARTKHEPLYLTRILAGSMDLYFFGLWPFKQVFDTVVTNNVVAVPCSYVFNSS